MTTPNSLLPQQIYVIRHGEKPADPPAASPGQPTSTPGPPFGVNINGNQNAHSLLPRGWQRSGALAVLFDPTVGALQAGLRTPTALYSPSYGQPDKTQTHRTYQTIQGLSERLGCPHPVTGARRTGTRPRRGDSGQRRRGGADLLGTSPHSRPRSGHPDRRRHHHPHRVARRPIRRHLDLRPRCRHRTLRVRPSPPTTPGRRHRHRDLSPAGVGVAVLGYPDQLVEIEAIARRAGDTRWGIWPLSDCSISWPMPPAEKHEIPLITRNRADSGDSQGPADHSWVPSLSCGPARGFR